MPTTHTAMALIPHGGPAIAIFVGAILGAVIAAIVAIETKRRPAAWAAASFVVCAVVLSAGVDALVR